MANPQPHVDLPFRVLKPHPHDPKYRSNYYRPWPIFLKSRAFLDAFSACEALFLHSQLDRGWFLWLPSQISYSKNRLIRRSLDPSADAVDPPRVDYHPDRVQASPEGVHFYVPAVSSFSLRVFLRPDKVPSRRPIFRVTKVALALARQQPTTHARQSLLHGSPTSTPCPAT